MTLDPLSAAEPLSAVAGRLLGHDTPRATSFIVTIYGDAVEPRGGTVWMGSLVACCSGQGISESLVRTAVSRLVAAGRLLGERVGRKSYYRLTDAARAEFRAAAKILFDPSPPPTDWRLSLSLSGGEAALPPGWVPVGRRVAMAPNRADIAPFGDLVLTAAPMDAAAPLPAFVAEHWPVAAIGSAYAAFLAAYRPLAEALGAGGAVEGATALALRLRLVDDYRRIALTDPRLPIAALPADWPADAARAVFVRCYIALSGAADGHIAATFCDVDGLLTRAPEPVSRRLDRLRRETLE